MSETLKIFSQGGAHVLLDTLSISWGWQTFSDMFALHFRFIFLPSNISDFSFFLLSSLFAMIIGVYPVGGSSTMTEIPEIMKKVCLWWIRRIPGMEVRIRFYSNSVLCHISSQRLIWIIIVMLKLIISFLFCIKVVRENNKFSILWGIYKS